MCTGPLRTSASLLLASSLAAALVACGGSRARPPVVAPAEALAPAATAEPEGEAVLLPYAPRPWIAGGEPDGTRYVVVGPLRVSLARAGGPTWAEQRFAAPVVLAVRVAAGWVFVAADGAVARSASFVGPLERLGSIAGFEDRGRRSLSGRMVALDADGVIWTTDGSTPVERLVVPDGAAALDAVFVDARRGAVALDGGRLFQTADGGSSWRPVDLAGDAVLQLDATQGRIVVSTLAARRQLDDSGALGAEVPASATLPDVEPLPEQDTSTLRDKLLLVEPALVEAWGVARADGTALLALERDLLVVERQTGRVLERHPAHLPERCRLSPWGAHVAVSCGSAGLFRVESGVALTQVGTRSLGFDQVFSDDGQHAAAYRGCEGGDAPSRLCVLAPGSLDPRVLELHVEPELSVTRVSAMHGATMVVRGSTMTGEQVVLVDARSGEATPLRVSGGEEDEDAPTVFDAWWADDGTLLGIGGWQRWSQGPRVLLRGASPTALEASPLPIGARRVGFVDARVGFAVGRHAGRLWQTIDGGERWSPLLAPIEGLPATVSFEEYQDDMACRLGSCVVRDRLLLRAQRGPAARRPVLAATVRRPERTPERQGLAARQSYRGHECRLAGAPRAQAALPRSSAPRSAAVRSLLLAGAGGRARVDVWCGPEGPVLQIAWRAEDARGAFQGRTRTLALSGDDASADDQDAPTSVYVLRGVSRAGVLVDRCARGTFTCGVLWGGAEQEPRLVSPTPSSVRGVRPQLEQAVPLPDGGFLLLWQGFASPGQLSILTQLDPRGQLVRRRVLRWLGNRYATFVALALREGRAGLVLEDPATLRRLVFHPLDSELAEELPRLREPGEVEACGAAEPASGTWLWSTRLFVPRLRNQDEVRARLELDAAGRLCVRSVETWLARWTSTGAATERGVSLRPDGATRLTGIVDQGASRQRLDCTADR